MISPIGTFLTRMDGALVGGMDSVISAMTSAMATPVALAAVAYYGVQGLKLANGDPSPMHNFVPQLIRVTVVIWLSSNLDAFNYWVRGIFFTGLPNALSDIATGGTGRNINSLSATAAAFDNIWLQLWVIVGTVWMQVGFSVTGLLIGLGGLIAALVGGLALVVLALVYLCARMVLAIVVCVSPVLIGCALFDATRPIFERSVGKVVSLVLLQALGFVLLQILLAGHRWFMAQATTAVLAAVGTGTHQLAEALEVIAAMTVWFVAGAYAMLQLPAVAYSIGGGISLSGPSLLGLALIARGFGGGGGAGAAARVSAAGGMPNLRLSLAARSLPDGSGGAARALPPPPPPSLSSSTRR